MTALEEVRWINLPSNIDSRGILTSVESDRDIPFAIQRVFYMHHVVTDRGGHAHLDTDQVVTGIAGQFKVTLSDGQGECTFALDDPTRGLYIPRMIFIDLHDFSHDAVCMVFASTHYDMSRSLRSRDAYLAHLQQGGNHI